MPWVTKPVCCTTHHSQNENMTDKKPRLRPDWEPLPRHRCGHRAAGKQACSCMKTVLRGGGEPFSLAQERWGHPKSWSQAPPGERRPCTWASLRTAASGLLLCALQDALGRVCRTQGGAPVRPGPVLGGSMPSLCSLAHRGPETGPGVARCSDAGPGCLRGAGLLSPRKGAFPSEGCFPAERLAGKGCGTR